MTWSKLHHSLLSDPDVMDLSASAFRTWTLAIVYCGDKLTDGYVSPKALRRIIQSDTDDTRELVSVGLWEQLGEGWQVVGYAEHQQTRSQVEADKEKARQRQAKRRESSGEVRAESRRDSTVSHAEVTPTDNRCQITDTNTDFASAKNARSDPAPTSKATKPRKQRARTPRDDVFDALLRVSGGRPDAQVPATQHAHIGKLATELNEVGATATDVVKRAAKYKRLHPDWELTPASLVKYWSDCEPSAGPAKKRECRKHGEPVPLDQTGWCYVCDKVTGDPK